MWNKNKLEFSSDFIASQLRHSDWEPYGGNASVANPQDINFTIKKGEKIVILFIESK